jgi:hypothetical protein
VKCGSLKAADFLTKPNGTDLAKTACTFLSEG